MLDNKFNVLILFVALIVAIILMPFFFNLSYLIGIKNVWGETSDWFTLYGNIFGGLIGGFFTYLALLLTIKHEKKLKDEELKPELDIPYQQLKFEAGNKQIIPIEIRNIGGSLAKNIECTLVLSNFHEVINRIEENSESVDISLLEANANRTNNPSIKVEGKILRYKNQSEADISTHAILGGAYSSYSSEFIGHCIPLKQDSSAKVDFYFDRALILWIQSLSEMFPEKDLLEKNLIFDFELNLKYSSVNYGVSDKTYRIEWKYVQRYWEEVNGEHKIWNEFLLKSELIKEKGKE